MSDSLPSAPPFFDTLLAADTLARQRALEPASFIVEAPAGAGKTELLTQRTLRLLAGVDHPEEVVALTFTNKAASEMRERILGSLKLAQTGERPGDDAPHRQITYDLGRAALARDAERGWKLLQNPGRLAVTTLDALCGSLARQMPLLSRFGAQPGIAEQPEEHYRDAARRTLALLEETGPEAEILNAALDYVDNHHGRLENLLVRMLSRRDQWLPHASRPLPELREEAEAGLQALAQRDLNTAARAISGRWQSTVMPAARFAANTLLASDPHTALAPLADWATPLHASPEDVPRWCALAELALTQKGEPRKRLTKSEGFPPGKESAEIKEAMLAACAGLDADAAAALQALRELPPRQYDDATWTGVETFSQVLKLAAAQLWLVFQENGVVDFSEMTQRALLALGEDDAPTDLALALDYRIRHLLVDEFQDTSPTQVRLIAGLTRGWSAEDGRTLFLVGDPMQSIYRFRKADVGLFLKVRGGGIGNVHPENLRLARNNRSFPPIVDWVNSAFPSIFPATDDPLSGAVRYAPSVATRPAESGSGIQVHPAFVADEEAGDAPDEAAQMLTVIRQTRREHPEGRIAVLVRARAHLENLVATLRREEPGLRFQAVETEPLGGRQAIQDILSLAHALFHRADRVHWLAILRAPWCGLTLADLHALAADAPTRTIWSLLQEPARVARLSADGQQRLLPLIATLHAAFKQYGRSHPRRWIESVWRQLDGPNCLARPGDHDAVASLFALIDQLVASRRFSADTLDEEIAALYAPADAASAAAQLQLMTIHKSKGLEFDTVLLPGLHLGSGHDDAPLLIWDEIPAGDGTEEFLIAAPMPRTGERDASAIYTALRRQEQERSRHESERLLYVAATRARHSLHLFGSVGVKESQLRAPGRNTLLGLLWPGEVGSQFAAAWAARSTQAAIAPTSNDQAFIPQLCRLAQVASVPAAQPDTQPAAMPERAATAGSLDISVGTLTHRCLELIAREGLTHWNAERIQPLTAQYRSWLQTQGHAQAEAQAGAERVARILTTTLASETGRWVLQAHDQQGAEQAYTRRSPEGPEQHIIDRSFVADGTRWIIDYKTLHSTETDAAKLQAKAETYREQLERYASLFADEERPVRMAIYFVEQGVLCKLEG